MTLRAATDRLADEGHKCVTGFYCADIRARLVRTACTIHLARCDAGKPYTRAFLAPYRAVTIPNPYGRANELLTCWYDRHLRRDEDADKHFLQPARERDHIIIVDECPHAFLINRQLESGVSFVIGVEESIPYG